MSWETVGQIALLMLLAYLLFTTSVTHVIDKRRESDIKRKQAGVNL